MMGRAKANKLRMLVILDLMDRRSFRSSSGLVLRESMGLVTDKMDGQLLGIAFAAR
jgi:hypothetical protein